MILLLIILSVSPVKDFRYAQGLFYDEFYDLAEVELTRFLEKYPNSVYSPDASILLLNSFNLQGSYEKAIQRAPKFLLKYPQKKEEILLEWGKAELGLGKSDDAITVFKRLSDVNRQEMWIGEVYFYMERNEEALEHYLKSNLPYSKLSAGWSYMKLGDYDKASSIFIAIKGEYEEEGRFLYAKALYLKGDEGSEDALFNYLKSYPKGKYRGRSYALLGDIYFDRGDNETAIFYFKNIFEQDPILTGYALYKIGLIYYEEGNYEFAIETFSKVDLDDPYWWDALYWMALSEIKLGMIEEAIPHLKEVIRNSKELSSEVLFELGSLYDQMGEYENALSVLQKVDGEFKDEAMIVIGNVLLKMNQFDEASSVFMKVVNEGEDNVSLALLQAAISKKKAGNEEEAIALLDSYEKHFPHGKEIDKVRLLKGDIFLNQSKYRIAIDEYKRISEEKAPDLVPYILEGQAWAYVGIKRYDLAFLTLERLSDEFPDFCSRPEIYLQLGNAAYAMGNFSEAEKAYRQVKGDLRPKSMFLLGRMFFEKENYNDAIRAFQDIRNQFSLSEYSSFASYYIALSLRKKANLMASTKQLYSIISEVKNKEVLYKSFLLLGDNYFDHALYDSSLKYYQRGFDLVFVKGVLEEPSFDRLPAIRGILLSVKASSGSSSMESKARDLIRKLKDTPDEPEINLLVGNILYNSGEYDRALDYLEESDSPISLYNAGMAYLKLGRREEAVQFLKKAAISKEMSDKAYLELGRIMFEVENYNKAKEYLSRSSLTEALLLYALSLYKKGNAREAMSKLEELKDKVEGLAYLELARIQMDSEMYERALNNLEKAIDYERAAPEAYYLTGRIFLNLDKKDEAFKALLKVKYIYPESKWVSPSLLLLSKISLLSRDTTRAINYLNEIINRGEDNWVEKAKSKISELR
ncbi:tetratricopeptide repeat protein [candidate division WOR-3 bacterium]|nr:tetratricopeptide repeat protein [candidate division WOR-3 bacterium]